jgi:hypothetical protein
LFSIAELRGGLADRHLLVGADQCLLLALGRINRLLTLCGNVFGLFPTGADVLLGILDRLAFARLSALAGPLDVAGLLPEGVLLVLLRLLDRRIDLGVGRLYVLGGGRVESIARPPREVR